MVMVMVMVMVIVMVIIMVMVMVMVMMVVMLMVVMMVNAMQSNKNRSVECVFRIELPAKIVMIPIVMMMVVIVMTIMIVTVIGYQVRCEQVEYRAGQEVALLLRTPTTKPSSINSSIYIPLPLIYFVSHRYLAHPLSVSFTISSF
jgi:predicted membrane protein